MHRGGATRPQTDLKVYDYLWVGEGGRSGDRLREVVKDHPPYAVPCLDMSRATVENEEELYLHSIPYLQFPLLLSVQDTASSGPVVTKVRPRAAAWATAASEKPPATKV